MKKVDFEQFNKELKDLMDKHGVAELRVTQQISIIPQMETAEETPTEETKCACNQETCIGGAEVEIGGVCHRPNDPCYVIEQPMDTLKQLQEKLEETPTEETPTEETK